jgi:hypothetical protein
MGICTQDQLRTRFTRHTVKVTGFIDAEDGSVLLSKKFIPVKILFKMKGVSNSQKTVLTKQWFSV